MSAENFPALRRKLLRWYDRHRRDLPWRRSADPYAIWISETMLQQTQVKTVLPYYERFLSAFPNVEALARAPLARVLRLWSGLGYYRRAGNLSAAARRIVRRHGGRLPSDYAQVRALPGIGEYSAGAILSIAFQQPYPALDGNARRVLGRLQNIHGEDALRALAAKLISKARPGDFNQALMELGATLCTPAAPRCAACPLKRECRSAAAKALARPPRRAVKFIDVTWPLAIVRRRGKILLRRRAAGDLLGRLWELPGAPLTARIKPAGALRRELNSLSEQLGAPRRIGAFRHAITRRRIRAPVYLLECDARAPVSLPRGEWRWLRPDRFEHLPMSSMTKKALALLAAHETRSA